MFAAAVGRGFRNCVNFRGRAGRAEFWWWMLFSYGVAILLWSVEIAAEVFLGSGLSFVVGGAGFLFWLGTLLPDLAVNCRRLHDRGRSGWWQVLPWPFGWAAVLALWPAAMLLILDFAFADIWWLAAGGAVSFLFWLAAEAWLVVQFIQRGPAEANRYGPPSDFGLAPESGS